MPLPIAHGLLGASITLGKDRSWRVLATGAALGVGPDLDLVFVLAGVRGSHRGFSHSLLSAILVGLIAFAVTRSGHRSFVFGTAWLSHGLLDFATSARGGGVKLLWPMSERYKLGLWSFSEFPDGYRLHELFIWVWLELLIFGLLFVGCLLIARRRESRAAA